MTSRPVRATEIALTGMRFHVRVGILPHERDLPQPLELDLRVGLAPLAPALDYRELYAVVGAVMGRAPHEFLETVASLVIDAAVLLPGVAWARVAVRKPHVLLGGPLEAAEIVMEASA